MRTALFTIAAAVLVALGGCQSDHDSMMPGSTTPAVTVTPKDGATGVRLDAPVSLAFSRSVDRAVTERSLHLFSQQAMEDSACPMGMATGQDMMGMSMTDSSMMRHLIGQHATPGRFVWNGDSTACTFLPDSMMAPNMIYMIHLGREMMQMMGVGTDGMQMMGGHGSGMMSEEMMVHFTTMDTAGGGHGGHH